MILDARQLVPGSSHESQICIVGGGPLGLLLAKDLASNGRKVAVLEAGALEATEEAKRLLQGEDLTGNYDDMADSRHCQLGGTVNIWNTPVNGGKGAKYVPLDPMDFEKRDWVAHSGWPFPKETLDPYYRRAHELFGLGPFDYEADTWADPAHPPFSFADREVISRVYQLGTAEPFLGDLLSFVKNSPDITCVINAPVSELAGEKGSSEVQEAKIVLGNGQTATFSARCFVVAAGGIENARLLLASTSQCPAGLGNEHDVVGRYYMDHPVYFFTEIVPHQPDLFSKSGYYDLRKQRQTTLLGRLTLPEEVQRRERLLNLSVVVYPRIAAYHSRGIEALRQFRILLRKRKFLGALPYVGPTLWHSSDILHYFRELSANPHGEADHFWQKAASEGTRFATFEPQFYLEQPPVPTNRIVLSQQKDVLGRPLAAAQTTWDQQSRESAHRAAEIIGQAMEKAGIGTLRLLENPRLNPSAHHHMGATRLSDDPKQGVADANARMHGADNVYIAGSSLFPTAGYVNPTLTALALCLKLSDHLQSKTA